MNRSSESKDYFLKCIQIRKEIFEPDSFWIQDVEREAIEFGFETGINNI